MQARIINNSQVVIGQNKYWGVFNQLNDSILNWQNHKLKWFNEDTTKIKSQIDSILCFNEKGNKMITARFMTGNVSNNDVMDGIIYYYGAKINNQWYFFSGATIYLPREYYQKDIHTPLSFEKLHEIAMKEVFSGYLIKDEKGNWQINDKFFDYHFKESGWGCGHLNEKGYWIDTCNDAQFEQLYLNKAKSVWEK